MRFCQKVLAFQAFSPLGLKQSFNFSLSFMRVFVRINNSQITPKKQPTSVMNYTFRMVVHCFSFGRIVVDGAGQCWACYFQQGQDVAHAAIIDEMDVE